MQIYSLPEHLPAPDFTAFTHERSGLMEASDYDKACDEHCAKVVEWARAQGYTGRNTGRRYREGAGDGYAQYVMIEPAPRSRGGKTGMIHLPYVDGYHARTLPHMTKKAVLVEITRQERAAAYFATSGED